jgi:Methyltransferase domain
VTKGSNVDDTPTSTNADAAAAARALLGDLPRLHYWGGMERVGGLNRAIGERIIAEIERYDGPRVIETGAGNTSLLFCALGAAEVTSIAPDAGLHERMLAAAAERDISVERLRFLCERSESALPKLAADEERFEIGLIDGSHNWPSVFVDFCYMNMMLPEGGTLFVDDTHLFSVAQLCLLLRQEEAFEYLAIDAKMATFRKLTGEPFLPEWRSQPYIEQNTLSPPRPPISPSEAQR